MIPHLTGEGCMTEVTEVKPRYEAGPSGDFDWPFSVTKDDGLPVALVQDGAEAAAFVRALNSHEAMKEALRDARDRIEALRDPSVNGVWNDALKRKIDAALSSVEDTQS
jgi:hypothetical protein